VAALHEAEEHPDSCAPPHGPACGWPRAPALRAVFVCPAGPALFVPAGALCHLGMPAAKISAALRSACAPAARGAGSCSSR